MERKRGGVSKTIAKKKGGRRKTPGSQSKKVAKRRGCLIKTQRGQRKSVNVSAKKRSIQTRGKFCRVAAGQDFISRGRQGRPGISTHRLLHLEYSSLEETQSWRCKKVTETFKIRNRNFLTEHNRDGGRKKEQLQSQFLENCAERKKKGGQPDGQTHQKNKTRRGEREHLTHSGVRGPFFCKKRS